MDGFFLLDDPFTDMDATHRPTAPPPHAINEKTAFPEPRLPLGSSA